MTDAAVTVERVPDVLDPTLTSSRVICAVCGEWLFTGRARAERVAEEHRRMHAATTRR